MSKRQASSRPIQDLGSAQEGAGNWAVQRVTGIALIPLTLWFTASLVAHVGDGYGQLVLWLQMPINIVMMVLLLIAVFWHAALGLQVIVEDYMHSSFAKGAALIAIWLGAIALSVTGIIAVLRIAFRT